MGTLGLDSLLQVFGLLKGLVDLVGNLISPRVTITAKPDLYSITMPGMEGTVLKRRWRNLYVRVVNHDRDHPINVETLHFVINRNPILLEDFHPISDLGARGFTVPPENNAVYIADGGKLASNLRNAGYNGKVDGFIKLKTKTDKPRQSGKISFSVDDLGELETDLNSVRRDVTSE